jgi:hypothetical protein
MSMLHERFHDDLASMLRYIIDQHSAGWSQVGTECYCHPRRDRDAETAPYWITEKEMADTDIEWVYAFDEENHRLYIRDIRNREDAGIVELAEPEPDWLKIECGEELERCRHYAWVHFPETRNMSNLSTQTYLGKREFEFQDAIAFMVNGKRYQNTGSGGNSSYLNRCASSKRLWPHELWIQTVKAGNGHSIDMPVAYCAKEGYKPYRGVTWVFPPTKDNPSETLRAE